MRKFTTTFVAGMVAVGLLAMASVNAYAAPSAKFTAEVGKALLIPEGKDSATVLQTTLKTPNKKDLLIGVSLQTGLYTSTKVSSKNGISDSSEASAKLAVKVIIDNNLEPLFPGEVIYDERVQTLTATLGGIITTCQDVGTFTFNTATGECVETLGIDPLTGLQTVHIPDGVLTVPCECAVADETIELALKTTGAHHFNFVAKNLQPGVHSIAVVVTKTTAVSDPNVAKATALLGPGSLTVEEVRATNSPDGIEFTE